MYFIFCYSKVICIWKTIQAFNKNAGFEQAVQAFSKQFFQQTMQALN
jgi:hypothetical protein